MSAKYIAHLNGYNPDLSLKDRAFCLSQYTSFFKKGQLQVGRMLFKVKTYVPTTWSEKIGLQHFHPTWPLKKDAFFSLQINLNTDLL